jgi:hypothetical protein
MTIINPNSPTMNIKILASCHGDSRHLEAGSITEVSTEVGKELIGLGRARIATDDDVDTTIPAASEGESKKPLTVAQLKAAAKAATAGK